MDRKPYPKHSIRTLREALQNYWFATEKSPLADLIESVVDIHENRRDTTINLVIGDQFDFGLTDALETLGIQFRIHSSSQQFPLASLMVPALCKRTADFPLILPFLFHSRSHELKIEMQYESVQVEILWILLFAHLLEIGQHPIEVIDAALLRLVRSKSQVIDCDIIDNHQEETARAFYHSLRRLSPVLCKFAGLRPKQFVQESSLESIAGIRRVQHFLNEIADCVALDEIVKYQANTAQEQRQVFGLELLSGSRAANPQAGDPSGIYAPYGENGDRLPLIVVGNKVSTRLLDVGITAKSLHELRTAAESSLSARHRKVLELRLLDHASEAAIMKHLRFKHRASYLQFLAEQNLCSVDLGNHYHPLNILERREMAANFLKSLRSISRTADLSTNLGDDLIRVLPDGRLQKGSFTPDLVSTPQLQSVLLAMYYFPRHVTLTTFTPLRTQSVNDIGDIWPSKKNSVRARYLRPYTKQRLKGDWILNGTPDGHSLILHHDKISAFLTVK